jgi:lipopolysaccharide cholinephosphotransferase
LKAKDFVQEVRESVEYYENFEKEYCIFQVYQEKVGDTLRAFHEICEKEHINYQLAFGSLLGIIRDGGQIPWDYDADVIVPAIERTKLIEALKQHLNSNYYFYSIEQNTDCTHVILRIAPKEFDTNFLHLDVFFVAGLPEEKEKVEKYKKRICELALQYKAKNFNFLNLRTNSKKEALNMFLYKIKGLFKNKTKIWSEYKDLAVKYPTNRVEFCCLADRFSDWYDLPTSMLYETELLETTIGTYRIPKEFGHILRIQYGDYTVAPPLKNRMEEFKRHYDFLTKNCPLGEKNDTE